MDPAELAAEFVTEGFPDATSVLTGARHIVVEDIATDADVVGRVRDEFYSRGSAIAEVVEGKEDAGAKYRD